MTKRTLTALSVLAVLMTGCGESSDAPITVQSSDANAVAKSVGISVNGRTASEFAGSLPATSPSGDRPTLSVANSRVQAGQGARAQMNFTITGGAGAPSALYLQVQGAQSYSGIDLRQLLTKAIPTRLSLDIELPDNLLPGEFCLDVAVADSEAQVSSTRELCVDVVDTAVATVNPLLSLVGPWDYFCARTGENQAQQGVWLIGPTQTRIIDVFWDNNTCNGDPIGSSVRTVSLDTGELVSSDANLTTYALRLTQAPQSAEGSPVVQHGTLGVQPSGFVVTIADSDLRLNFAPKWLTPNQFGDEFANRGLPFDIRIPSDNTIGLVLAEGGSGTISTLSGDAEVSNADISWFVDTDFNLRFTVQSDTETQLWTYTPVKYRQSGQVSTGNIMVMLPQKTTSAGTANLNAGVMQQIKPTPVPSPTPTPDPTPAEALAQLQGVWSFACNVASDGSESFQGRWKITNNDVDATEAVWLNGDCSGTPADAYKEQLRIDVTGFQSRTGLGDIFVAELTNISEGETEPTEVGLRISDSGFGINPTPDDGNQFSVAFGKTADSPHIFTESALAGATFSTTFDNNDVVELIFNEDRTGSITFAPSEANGFDEDDTNAISWAIGLEGQLQFTETDASDNMWDWELVPLQVIGGRSVSYFEALNFQTDETVMGAAVLTSSGSTATGQ